mmetsp:Transcript_43862/g.92261  ORF Transcript_43862/g.92261 Transcript_43862/m.92261 type:complete len:106 (+) Transcript_43862:183-500(+)
MVPERCRSATKFPERSAKLTSIKVCPTPKMGQKVISRRGDHHNNPLHSCDHGVSYTLQFTYVFCGICFRPRAPYIKLFLDMHCIQRGQTKYIGAAASSKPQFEME